MDATLLDTDILSEILKQRNPRVMAKASAYLDEHGRFTFSAFSPVRGVE
jgi:tRNA(fMet)-specific endonuclease VapC